MTRRVDLHRRTVLSGAIGALAVLGFPAAANAQSLDQLRADGVIAERFDGLVEIRGSNASQAARKIVSDINAKRRDLYRNRAKQQDVPAEAVGKVYAKKIWKKAPSGTYLRKPDGGYVQK